MPTNSKGYWARYYQEHKPKFQEYKKKHYTKNAEYLRKLRFSRRSIVLNHYGNRCNCCGEVNYKFLTIDHVDNNGAQERREMNINRAGGSDRLITKILKDNFPGNYQILCYNCNCGKARNGGICPHFDKD